MYHLMLKLSFVSQDKKYLCHSTQSDKKNIKTITVFYISLYKKMLIKKYQQNSNVLLKLKLSSY